MPYTHKCGGSSHTITTTSPIYSNLEGGKPQPTTDSFPAYKITHAHKSPAGEDMLNHRPEPRSAGGTSGSNYRTDNDGKGRSGATAVPGWTARATRHPLDRAAPRGIPDRDGFNKAIGDVGTGVGRKMRPAKGNY